MLYLLALILPPLAVFLTGRKTQTLLNIILTIIGWLPGVIHAFFIVHKHNERRSSVV
ncbi:YqaE/Pmp3 family membrane protein [Alkalihalobacillus sp. AL-G]|uniref:YqaE/Pmp3 family membrane protein n=1 Tax=Alkalihalobacillus sp. AL-G TaxID=2926399 RepID=UPI00272D5B71|nr:YqaE/Pmp3 family membrane protein [Alkalihalobacillus sp. AL-G]WLD95328.1 YqaE/Pmp3 family membrane protein [Alkalihalobacillus sp. AL-G]